MILLLENHMVEALLRKSLRNLRRFFEIIKHGALEIHTLEIAHFESNMHLVNLSMIFVRRWLR